MNKILVIAAHPDDEVLGAGGTIKKYINKGYHAECLILGEGITSRASGRDSIDIDLINSLQKDSIRAAIITGYNKIYFSNFPDNRFDSIDLLDIIKVIEEKIETLKPSIIYTHHYNDLNIDHKTTFEAVLTATRPLQGQSVKEIYCFEVPSSTEWSFSCKNSIFKPNIFIDIEDTIENKLKAMKAYTTELREFPHPRSIKALKIIASRWGTVVGKKYVEAFELIRKVD